MYRIIYIFFSFEQETHFLNFLTGCLICIEHLAVVLLQGRHDKVTEINPEHNCFRFVLFISGDLSALKIKLPMWLIL